MVRADCAGQVWLAGPDVAGTPVLALCSVPAFLRNTKYFWLFSSAPEPLHVAQAHCVMATRQPSALPVNEGRARPGGPLLGVPVRTLPWPLSGLGQ
jgi:hypothetical protein